MILEKEVQELRGKKVCISSWRCDIYVPFVSQLSITESMRRRDGLVEQKAGLVSSNETLEKEITVSSTVF